MAMGRTRLEGSRTLVGRSFTSGIPFLYKTPNLQGVILGGKASSGRGSNLVFSSLHFGYAFSFIL